MQDADSTSSQNCIPPLGWRLISRDQVIQLCGISPATLAVWVKSGLKRYSPPRSSKHFFFSDQVMEFIAQYEVIDDGDHS